MVREIEREMKKTKLRKKVHFHLMEVGLGWVG
jgi:hypothetical protein